MAKSPQALPALEPEADPTANITPEAVAEELSSSRNNAGISAILGLDADPDQAARAAELANTTGDSPGYIYGNLDDYENRTKSALSQGLIQNDEFLQNYINAHPLASKVSNDDWGNLSDVSESLKKLHSGLFGLPAAMVEAAGAGFKREMEAAGPPDQWAADEAAKMGLGRLGFAELAAVGYLPELSSHVYAGVLGAIHDSAKTFYERIGYSPGEADASAKDLTAFGESEFMRMTGRATPAEEFLHPAVHMGLQAAFPWFEAGKIPPPGVNPIFHRMHEELAKIDNERLDNVLSDLGKTNTLQRSPELMQTFLDQYPDAKIGIDAEAVRKLYGDKTPVADDGLLGWVPNIREQMNLAEAAGGDIEVPLGTFLHNMAKLPDVAKELHDDIRVRPGSLTLREIKENPAPPLEVKGSETEPVPGSGPAVPAAEAAETALPEEELTPEAQAEKAEVVPQTQEVAKGPLESWEETTPGKEYYSPAFKEFKFKVGGQEGEIRAKQYGDDLKILWIGAPFDADQGEVLHLGPAAIQEIRRRLKEAYPETKTISGNRISGVRGNRGGENIRVAYQNAIDSLRKATGDTPSTGLRPVQAQEEVHQFKLLNDKNKVLFIQPKGNWAEREQALIKALDDYGRALVPNWKGIIQATSDLSMSGRRIRGVHIPYSPQRHNILPVVAYALHDPKGKFRLPNELIGTLRHEFVHVLKEGKFFTDDEWSTLEEAAKEYDWVKKHNIDALYPNASPELKLEEAIAEEFGEWNLAPRSTHIAAPMFKRMREALLGMRDTIKKVLGYDPAVEDIFHKIHSGEIGQRVPDLRSKEIRPQAAAEKEPELPIEGTTRMEDRPTFKTAGAMGLNKKLYDLYHEHMAIQAEGDAEAQRKLGEKLERDRQTKEWKENEARVRDEVRHDLSQRPDLAADIYLREGYLYGEKSRRLKINSSEVPAELRGSIPAEYLGADGIHPDDLAGLFGYTSGRELLERLAGLETQRQLEGRTPRDYFNQLVNAATERKMATEYGSLEDNILEAAKDHVLGDTALDHLHEQLVRIATEQGVELPFTKEGIKSKLLEQFNAAPVGSHSSDTYIAQAGRAMQTVEKGLLEGDARAAFKGRYEHYVSSFLAGQARKLEKVKAGFAKQLKSLVKREIPGVPENYAVWIHDILMRSGHLVRTTIDDLQRAIGRQEHKTFVDFAKARSEQFGLPLMFPDYMYEANWFKKAEDMSTEDYLGLVRATKTLATLGRKENKFLLQGKEEDRVRLREQMIEQATEQPRRKITENPTRVQKAIGNVKQIAHKLIQMETSWNRLDNGDRFGIFNRAFSYPASDATGEFSDLVRKYGEKLSALPKINNPKGRLPGFFRRPSTGEVVDLTRENLIQMMRNIGTQSGLDKLVGGWEGTTPKNPYHALHVRKWLAWINQHATKEDWDFVRAEGKIHEEMFEEGERMIQNQGLTPPMKEPLRDVNTPFGVFPGWYHPVIWDQLEEGRSKKLMGQAIEPEEGLESTGYWRATTAKGWEKRRTSYIAPMYLHMDRSAGRMTTVLRDIAIRPYIIETSKMFYDPVFRNAMRDALGPHFRDKLNPFLQAMAGMGNSPLSRADALGRHVISTISRNTISTLVGGNIHTLEKHTLSAAINSLVEVGPINFAREMRYLTATGDLDPTLSNKDFAMKMSAELRGRVRNVQGTVSGEYERLLTGYDKSIADHVYEKGTAPIGYFDLMSAVPTWNAEYRSAIAELSRRFPNEDELWHRGMATDAANRAVRRAHGSSALSSRPEAMRGGPLSRTFTQLYGFFNQALQRNYEAMWRAQHLGKDFKEEGFVEGSKKLGMISLLLFQGVIAPAIVEELVTPYTNAERDSWGKWFVKTMAMGASGTIPLVREFVHGVISGTSSGFGLLGTQYEQVQSLVRDLNHGAEMMNAENGGKTIRALNTIYGELLGHTNNEIGNILKTTWDMTHHNRETPSNVYEFTRDVLTGHSKPRKGVYH